MGIWQAVKDWFGYTPADEIAKLKEAERKVATEVDKKIEETVESIVDLGKKIEEKIDEEVEVVKTKSKSVKKKVDAEVEVVKTKAKAAVKKVAKKK